MYRIVFVSSAAKEFRKLPKSTRQRIGQAIERLKDNPQLATFNL